jgi:hypothetical protein
MRQPTTPNKEGKFHRGKVKEVEMFQYTVSFFWAASNSAQVPNQRGVIKL